MTINANEKWDLWEKFMDKFHIAGEILTIEEVRGKKVIRSSNRLVMFDFILEELNKIKTKE